MGKSTLGGGNSECKGPGVGMSVVCWRNSKGPLWLVGESEGSSEMMQPDRQGQPDPGESSRPP